MRQILVIAILLVVSSCVHAQSGSCLMSQTFATPQSLALTLCTNYGSGVGALSCCSSSTAKRAWNYVLADDGCGIVGGTCRQFLTYLACGVNCAVNITARNVMSNNGSTIYQKIFICKDWADQLLTACSPYFWCATAQSLVSTCTFQSSTRTTSSRSQKDTCQAVSGLQAIDFVQNVLGYGYAADNENCYTPQPSAAHKEVPSVILIALLAILSMLALA